MSNNIFGDRRVAVLDIHSPLYIHNNWNHFGVGSISSLFQLIDRAAETGFSLIQMTPLQDSGLNPCPYMGTSIFSFNPVHLSIEKLPWSQELDDLKQSHASISFVQNGLVDYKSLYKFKLSCLRIAYKNLNPNIDLQSIESEVLNYAVFMALKNKFRTVWQRWPEIGRSANIETILKQYSDIIPEVNFHLWAQSVLKNEWLEVRDYAASKGIHFAIDKPIYPTYDSADVWANQSLFYLNSDGSLRYVSGCFSPGDPFGQQKWGHAVYKFKEKPDDVVNYFIKTVHHLNQISKVIRLDHTLALIWKYYIIDPVTDQGKHVPALKYRLFNPLLSTFPDSYFIAEDLGYVSTSEVDKPLTKLGIPGMRCIQWYDSDRYALPKKYPRLCFAFTSNHDLPGFAYWWKNLKTKDRKIYYTQTKTKPSTDKMADYWQVVKLLFSSPAQFAAITLRDLALDLRRYNTPGTNAKTNWVLQCPVKIEDMDFYHIANIIQTENRR